MEKLNKEDYRIGLDFIKYRTRRNPDVKAKDIQKEYSCYYDQGLALLKAATFIAQACAAGDIKIDAETGIVYMGEQKPVGTKEASC